MPRQVLALLIQALFASTSQVALNWPVGSCLADSIFTAMGKVGSRLKVVMIGTLGPMATQSGHWWYDLIHAGTTGSTYVSFYQGDLDTWDKWATIRKANPLIGLDAHTRKVVLEERDNARKDSRLRARFLTYRLNIPSQDSAAMLLSVDDWRKIRRREVPEREGRPVVALDVGENRSWCAAVAMFSNGRTEARALAPGLPSLSEQERRDHVPKGSYTRLHEAGILELAEGLHVPPPAQLWAMVRDTWGKPREIVCDRFKLKHLEDVIKNVKIDARVSQWSSASYDVHSLRKLARDGPLSVDVESRPLVEASLGVAMVENDRSGSCRMVKRGTHNEARDDIAYALHLIAGLYERQPFSKGSGVYLGFAG